VLSAIREWRAHGGCLRRTTAHRPTPARRGADAIQRFNAGDGPTASVVTGVFWSWAAARSAAAHAIEPPPAWLKLEKNA
jgi:hypothetical protein